MLKTITTLIACCCSLVAAAGPVVVAQDGSGDFRSVQAAIDASSPGAVIRIRPGTYEEKIVIDKPKIQLLGIGADPSKVVLSFNLSAGTAGGTFKSASTTVTGDDFVAENLTFENSFSRSHGLTPQGSQAVALRVTGDRAIFRRVRFLGYQDTLYATTSGCMNGPDSCKPARQYFQECYIEGNVDYIFGDALAYFENCEIHSLAHDTVAITAQSKVRPDEKSGYVFNHCSLTAEPGAKKVYLGRPWRSYASVVFLNSYMGPESVPAGWLEWVQGGRPSLPTVFYAEYNSQGPGANAAERDPHSVRLTAEQARKYEVRSFLAGDDGWNPTGVR
jgi:pectin methylesterase-like acyl-CoA thioesterase